MEIILENSTDKLYLLIGNAMPSLTNCNTVNNGKRMSYYENTVYKFRARYWNDKDKTVMVSKIYNGFINDTYYRHDGENLMLPLFKSEDGEHFLYDYEDINSYGHKEFYNTFTCTTTEEIFQYISNK